MTWKKKKKSPNGVQRRQTSLSFEDLLTTKTTLASIFVDILHCALLSQNLENPSNVQSYARHPNNEFVCLQCLRHILRYVSFTERIKSSLKTSAFLYYGRRSAMLGVIALVFCCIHPESLNACLVGYIARATNRCVLQDSWNPCPKVCHYDCWFCQVVGKLLFAKHVL